MRQDRTEVLFQGLFAGFIGYVSVVLFFTVVSVLTGESPFYTPALLGGILFYGVTDPAQTTISAGPVLVYNGLHLVIFLAFGIVAALLASLAERGAELWSLALFLLLFVSAHLFAAVQLFTEPVRDELPLWRIGGAMALAVVAIVGYLFWAHPSLRHLLQEPEGAEI